MSKILPEKVDGQSICGFKDAQALALDRSEDQLGHYVAGLFDGEGSFIAFWQKNSSGRPGNALACTISLQMRLDDEPVARIVMDKIGATATSRSETRARSNNRAPCVIYSVRRIAQLHNIVIPFFRKYKLIGKKGYDFEIWAEIVEAGFHKNKRWDPTAKESVSKLVDMLQASRRYGFFSEAVAPRIIRNTYCGCVNGLNSPKLVLVGRGE